MKKKFYIRVTMLLLACFVTCLRQSEAQDVSMHTQGIMQQEFLNPAYNSFKDYMSMGVYNRTQWGNKFAYSPKTYVANLYIPVGKSRIGGNLGVIVEDIGLRKTTELKASLCHNIRFTENSYLAFGYSVGFLQNAFDREKIISYPDEDLSFLLTQTDLTTLYPTVSLGMLFLTRHWFAGVSSMTTSIKPNMDDSKYLPGFDFSSGGMFRLSSWVYCRPGLIIKYYNERGIKSENGEIITDYKIPVIYDFSANFLLASRFWAGTSHRLKQAQTFTLDMQIGNSIKLGYTFELGIGKGLNQFNSHGIRLSYMIGKKRNEGVKDELDIWPGNDQSAENMASFIY